MSDHIMKYSSVVDPEWVDSDTIKAMVTFDHLGDKPVVFLAHENDYEPHGREIFARCKAGEFGVVKPKVEKTLGQQKSEALFEIDALAGKKRQTLITTAPGQEITYTRKLADAEKFARDGYPIDSNNYPWIEGEAQARGISTQEAAKIILEKAAQLDNIGARIESMRQKAKMQVNNAISKEVIDSSIAELKIVLNTVQ